MSDTKRFIGTLAAILTAGTIGAMWTGCGGGSVSTTGPGGGSTTSTTTTSDTTTSTTSGTMCGPGATLCNGTCTVTDFDPQNCGTCGMACAQGEVCSGGQCGLSCSGGTTKCGSVCVDTKNDPTNCGMCGMACAQGEVCSAGQCALDCAGGTTKCGTACVDINNDPANCGMCGMACATGEVCSGGKCASQCIGLTECNGACVDTNTDPNNCGGCMQPCPMGQVCSQAQCGVVCLGGTTLCNGKCVDTQNDPANCGMCAKACGTNEVCNAGACSSVCGGTLTKCGNNCVDTKTDAANCGMCGKACAAGETCQNGTCTQCDSATTDCDGDGWLVADGDCCDKPGPCGSEPAKVNPGAIEVVGNGIDDNCNGLTDLFDTADTVPCDSGLVSNSSNAIDYAKAIGICRQTTLNPPKNMKTWGLIDAKLQRADGSALPTTTNQVSIRPKFGTNINPLNGASMMVMSSGIAADATQTMPGPNGGAPGGTNVSTSNASTVNISTCTNATCIKDWFQTANPPLKAANALPVAPMCGSGTAGTPTNANDSVMLVLTLRAPTNAKAFSFNSFFFSAEYPEFVCTNFNDQLVALVDTPNGTPTPIANPIDKNLMTFAQGMQKWPVGINIAHGTSLFSACESQMANAACWDTDVSSLSCSLGINTLLGTGFDKPMNQNCTIGGGTFWLTTAGNVIPGDIVQIRIALWDVGDNIYDSLALVDGFQWLANATLPGTN
jgi:hypothetical protein